MFKNIFFIFLFVLVWAPVYPQFTTNGNASQVSCNCFDMTQSTANQNASFFSNTTIDLSSPFDYTFTLFFGCDDLGGEGMTFMLQSAGNNQIGGANIWNLAADGIAPSMLVEFDTRNNGTTTGTGQINNGDIAADHIDFLTNGSTDHNTNSLLAGPPVPTPNLENCQDRFVRITWNPGTNTMDVYLDDLVTPITSLTNDIVNNVFGGNPNVHWGWTASTGALPNEQRVCLSLDASFTNSAATCASTPVNFTADVTSFYPIVSYDWDFEANGTIDANGVNATYTFPSDGLYDVVLIVEDDQGCIVTDTLNFGVGFDLDINATATNVCPGGTVDLEAEPTPYIASQCQFTLTIGDTWGDGWNGNTVEIYENGTSIGTYFASNFGGGGGSPTETFNLFLNQGSTIDVCFNDNINNSLGEIFYSLEDGSGNVLVDQLPGTVTMGLGCSSFTVNCGLTPPTYNYTWTVISGTGTLDNYNIQNPEATVPDATTYEVTAEDQNSGCINTETITITVEPPVTAIISGNETVCQGDAADLTITFTGNPPYEFIYDFGSGPVGPISGINTSPYTLSVTDGGTYTITSVNGDGCPGTPSGSATVTVIAPPDVQIDPDIDYCDGEPVADVNAISTNGGTVNWYDDAGLTNLVGTGNSFTPPPLSVGSHTFYAQEEEGVLGCTGAVDDITITINPIPGPPTVTGNNTICDGDPAPAQTASGDPGAVFTWYDGGGNNVGFGTSFTPGSLTPGANNFSVTQTTNGCESNPQNFTITVNPTPGTINLGPDATYCENDPIADINVTPTNGGDIIWTSDAQGNNTIFTGNPYTPPGVVGVTTYYAYESLNGCDGPISDITITVNEAPAVLLPDTAFLCIGDSIQLFAENNGYDLLWDTGDTTATIWVGPDVTTSYEITTTNNCGTNSDQILVVVQPLPNIMTINDINTGLGADLTLSASGGETFYWEPQVGTCQNSNCSNYYIIPEQTDTFVVYGTDEYGCENTDTVIVTIDGDMEVFVPNIFSPNGDGWNDELVVKGPKLSDFHLMIFDRWGKLMFESDQQKIRWDGTFNDEPVSEGVYVYMLKGKTLLDKQIDKNGNVMVTR